MRNDELLDVVKVTEKTSRKGEDRVKKTKNSYVSTDKTCMEVNLAPNKLKNNSYLPIWLK